MNMDYQKALDFMIELCMYQCSHEEGACIKALQKQIPMRVYRFLNHDGNPNKDVCLDCGETVSMKMKFCPNCGQALDWSDI